jgi:diaminopimelate decarboxylase
MVRELKLADRVVSAAAREARRRKTPFYLLDARELARQIREWRAAAPGAVFYPYKCNRDERAVRAAAAAGLGAEVTTVDDLRRARRMRLSGARIIVQGPAKPAALLEAGLRTGALFVVDGREDVVALLARAHATGTTPRYLLRLAPRVVGPEQRAFGLPARPLVALARELARRGAPPAEGLAFHLGTGIASAAPFLAALREAAAVARALGALGWPVATLGVGGGFAARLESRGKEPQPPGPSAAEIVPALRRAARRLFDAERNVRLLFEPGRAIVSGAYHLVARVVRVRDGRAPVAYLDASALSHAPFVILGRHPIAVRPWRPGPERRVTLAGPLGVGNDVFARAVRLPPLRPGDLVVIGSVGAYNQNAANTWAGPAAEVRRGPT